MHKHQMLPCAFVCVHTYVFEVPAFVFFSCTGLHKKVVHLRSIVAQRRNGSASAKWGTCRVHDASRPHKRGYCSGSYVNSCNPQFLTCCFVSRSANELISMGHRRRNHETLSIRQEKGFAQYADAIASRNDLEEDMLERFMALRGKTSCVDYHCVFIATDLEGLYSARQEKARTTAAREALTRAWKALHNCLLLKTDTVRLPVVPGPVSLSWLSTPCAAMVGLKRDVRNAVSRRRRKAIVDGTAPQKQGDANKILDFIFSGVASDHYLRVVRCSDVPSCHIPGPGTTCVAARDIPHGAVLAVYGGICGCEESIEEYQVNCALNVVAQCAAKRGLHMPGTLSSYLKDNTSEQAALLDALCTPAKTLMAAYDAHSCGTKGIVGTSACGPQEGAVRVIVTGLSSSGTQEASFNPGVHLNCFRGLPEHVQFMQKLGPMPTTGSYISDCLRSRMTKEQELMQTLFCNTQDAETGIASSDSGTGSSTAAAPAAASMARPGLVQLQRILLGGLLPLVYVVNHGAPIPKGTHVVTDYGADYWRERAEEGTKGIPWLQTFKETLCEPVVPKGRTGRRSRSASQGADTEAGASTGAGAGASSGAQGRTVGRKKQKTTAPSDQHKSEDEVVEVTDDSDDER